MSKDISTCTGTHSLKEEEVYGRKGRIGLIVLDSDLTIEPDLRRLLPEGVEIHTARVIYPRRVTGENLAIASNGAIAAVEQLLPIRPSAIAWACTSGSFFGGRVGNDQIMRRLQEAAGTIPVTTASAALVAALNTLGIKRPMVGSPYSASINERLRAFLIDNGITPAGVRGLHDGELDDYELQDVESDRLEAFIEELARTASDGVIVSCTGLATAELAPRLEAKVGKPIISSNLAILWHCWKLASLDEAPLVDSRLFRTLSRNEGVTYA
jgi:maleate isomerase